MSIGVATNIFRDAHSSKVLGPGFLFLAPKPTLETRKQPKNKNDDIFPQDNSPHLYNIMFRAQKSILYLSLGYL